MIFKEQYKDPQPKTSSSNSNKSKDKAHYDKSQEKKEEGLAFYDSTFNSEHGSFTGSTHEEHAQRNAKIGSSLFHENSLNGGGRMFALNSKQAREVYLNDGNIKREYAVKGISNIDNLMPDTPVRLSHQYDDDPEEMAVILNNIFEKKEVIEAIYIQIKKDKQ